MKILFLGTGAADSMGKEISGKENHDLRRCASALIDGKILIDCGPFTLSALSEAGVNFSEITDLIITHEHGDHYDITSVKVLEENGVRVWAQKGSERIESFKKMEYLKEYSIGGLKVTSLPANHEASPQHLFIEENGKTLFYGLDGAWFLGDTVRFLENKEIDLFVFDATCGDYEGDYRIGEHNSIPMIKLMVPSLKTLKAINDNTKLVLSYMATCLHKSAEETEKMAEDYGLIAAYDFMEMEI